MSKITELLITLPLSDIQTESLEKLAANIRVHHIPTKDPVDIDEKLWEEIEVLYTDSVFPNSDQAANLRWIQTSTPKIDRETEMELSKRKDLQISTMEDITSIQVAEHAVSLLLALSRKLPQLFNLQENSEWLDKPEKNYRPKELYGSTVGIVGYGGEGRQIARLLKSFGCTVLASTQNAMKVSKKGFTLEGTGDPEGEFFTRLYPHQAISSMFKECDSVIITSQLTNLTRDLIGEKQFSSLNSDALFVDVSEGGVVNLEAITNLMADNKIAGAALDVFPEQPLPDDNLLWSLPNVILSPNLASHSEAHNKRVLELFRKNIIRYLDGQKLFNIRSLGAE